MQSHPQGVLPIMSYTGRLLVKEVPCSGFRYFKVLLVEVYKRVGKSIIAAVCEKDLKGLTGTLMAVKTFWFSDLFIFKRRFTYST